MSKYFKDNITLILFGIVLALAALMRFFVAPLSAGPDVAQFWAFAEVFRQHGLDFYRFAPAEQSIFPYYKWAFAYPPVWLLILGLAILCAPHSAAGQTIIDPSWRLAVKAPIILADLSVGILLYWGLPGSSWKKLPISTLWLLHPTVWYNSAVFGQFDAIACALLVASLLFLAKGRITAGFSLGILAAMTKQTTLIPLALMTAAYAGQYGWKTARKYIFLMGGVALAISLPFILTGNLGEYLRTFFLSGQKPDYLSPLLYSFNGLGSLATYLHQIKGWDTTGYFWFILPVMAACGLFTFFFVYLRKIDMLRAALIGILFFVAFYYRINYQYLVLMIALALIVAATTPYLSERILALSLAILPALWLWIFNVSFWFYCYEPKYYQISRVLSFWGLTHNSYPDLVYVLFALLLNILCLIYIVCALVRWPNPLRTFFLK